MSYATVLSMKSTHSAYTAKIEGTAEHVPWLCTKDDLLLKPLDEFIAENREKGIDNHLNKVTYSKSNIVQQRTLVGLVHQRHETHKNPRLHKHTGSAYNKEPQGTPIFFR